MQALAKYVKPGRTIADPFAGYSEKELKQIFAARKAHSTPFFYDATTPPPANVNLYVTAPPFAVRREALEWLAEQSAPFAVLVPAMTLTTRAVFALAKSRPLQYLVLTGTGQLWITHGLGLPQNIMFVPQK